MRKRYEEDISFKSLKNGRRTDDSNGQMVFEGHTLNEAVSHCPTSVTCFVD